jgi:hypothetical protein
METVKKRKERMTHYPWYSYLILVTPARVYRNLEFAIEETYCQTRPTPWQLGLGVLRMWYRLFFRPETIGLSSVDPLRDNWRARIFARRPLRFPFLLAFRSVAPFDYTGLRQSPSGLIRHVVGTHHEGNQVVYDLQVLDAYGALDQLYEQTEAIINGLDPRHEWFKDLCVYENYHTKLLQRIERWRNGDQQLRPADHRNPDLTFTGLLDWCLDQPKTPLATFRAWRCGQFTFEPHV